MQSDIRFTRGAWLNLGLAALLVGGTTLLLAYRFTLPTDGWNVQLPADQSTSNSGLIYVSNIELDDLSERLVSAVVETMQPRTVSLWLKEREARSGTWDVGSER